MAWLRFTNRAFLGAVVINYYFSVICGVADGLAIPNSGVFSELSENQLQKLLEGLSKLNPSDLGHDLQDTISHVLVPFPPQNSTRNASNLTSKLFPSYDLISNNSRPPLPLRLDLDTLPNALIAGVRKPVEQIEKNFQRAGGLLRSSSGSDDDDSVTLPVTVLLKFQMGLLVGVIFAVQVVLCFAFLHLFCYVHRKSAKTRKLLDQRVGQVC